MITGQRLHIITGTSRGLGEALALACIASGHPVLGMARQTSARLERAAAERGVWCAQWAVDLGDGGVQAAQRLASELPSIAHPLGPLAALAIIHNAARLADPQPLAQTPAEQTSAVLRVGLEAPMQLTQAFLVASGGLASDRRILAISSGLARRPMAGATAYCAAKAGLELFCQSLAREVEGQGVSVVALAPGVIDTDMQRQLREGDPAAFADSPLFAGLHARGELTAPSDAAARILAYLWRQDFGVQPTADIRQVA